MWLINLLAPKKYERSIDVFGGSGTVTLNLDCPPSLKVYNDFNSDLVNLMRCARKKPLALIREIGFLTLNSREEFAIFKKFINKEEFTEYDSNDDLKSEIALAKIMIESPSNEEMIKLLTEKSKEKDVVRAAIYYKLLRYSFSANADTFGGKKCDLRRFFTDIWNFYRAFAEVTIENKDFEKLLKQYDRKFAFIYCDPPYYDAEGFYAVCFPTADHERLHEVLRKAEGYVMVSYNYTPEILELYQDFYIFYTTRSNSMAHKEGEVYEELIMTNYDPRPHLNEKTRQLNLFGDFTNGSSEGEYKLIHEPPNPLVA